MASIKSYMKYAGYGTPALQVWVEFEGDWKRLTETLKYLKGSNNRGIRRDIAKAQRDFLTKLKIEVIKGLKTEGRSTGKAFHPWSSTYNRRGLSIGVRQGVYLGALQNLRIRQRKYVVSLSYNPADLHRKSLTGGLRLREYLLVFEHGTLDKTQPERPVWAQAFHKIGGIEYLAKRVKGAVGKRLRGYSFHSNVFLNES